MTRQQAELILAFAENDMKINQTGKKIFKSDPSVVYNLNKIQRQTGRNPRKFYDLCYLVGIAVQMIGGEKDG